jgi:hypothetical protein
MNVEKPHDIVELPDIQLEKAKAHGARITAAMKGAQKRYILLTRAEAKQLERASVEDRAEWLRLQLRIGQRSKPGSAKAIEGAALEDAVRALSDASPLLDRAIPLLQAALPFCPHGLNPALLHDERADVRPAIESFLTETGYMPDVRMGEAENVPPGGGIGAGQAGESKVGISQASGEPILVEEIGVPDREVLSDVVEHLDGLNEAAGAAVAKAFRVDGLPCVAAAVESLMLAEAALEKIAGTYEGHDALIAQEALDEIGRVKEEAQGLADLAAPAHGDSVDDPRESEPSGS